MTIIFDGDTIQVRLNDGSMEKVRLIGVDSPEMDDTREDVLFWAHMARRFAFHHLYRKKVTLSFDWERRDIYGRLLAYVRTLDGLFFNEFLIREGFAAALLVFPYEEKYRTLFKAAEEAARRQGRGMWRTGDSPVISDRDAARLAGQVLTVRFICESVQVRGDFAYLRSTESDFEALIPREKLALFPDWKSYESRALSVSGFLEIFKGTPQIMIFFPRQVWFLKSPAFLDEREMPCGLPRGTSRRGIQRDMPPCLHGADPCPAREKEAANEAAVGRGNREASSPSKLTPMRPESIDHIPMIRASLGNSTV